VILPTGCYQGQDVKTTLLRRQNGKTTFY